MNATGRSRTSRFKAFDLSPALGEIDLRSCGISEQSQQIRSGALSSTS
jgi:hypothetical protein